MFSARFRRWKWSSSYILFKLKMSAWCEVILLLVHATAYLLAHLLGTGSSQPHGNSSFCQTFTCNFSWVPGQGHSSLLAMYEGYYFLTKDTFIIKSGTSKRLGSTYLHRCPVVLASTYFASIVPAWLSGSSTKHRRNNFSDCLNNSHN